MQFATEGTDVGMFIFCVSAFAMIAFDVVSDADLMIVGCAEGAVGEFCPCRFSIIKFGWSSVIVVMENTVPPLSAEYAAWREGVPLAARRKGPWTITQTRSFPVAATTMSQIGRSVSI